MSTNSRQARGRYWSWPVFLDYLWVDKRTYRQEGDVVIRASGSLAASKLLEARDSWHLGCCSSKNAAAGMAGVESSHATGGEDSRNDDLGNLSGFCCRLLGFPWPCRRMGCLVVKDEEEV